MSTCYQQSAKVVQQVLNKKGDIKTLLYHNIKQGDIINPLVYALVHKTIEFHPLLKEIIAKTPKIAIEFNRKSNHSAQSLFLILIYELLFGNKKNLMRKCNKNKKYTRMILENKNALHSALVRMKIRLHVSHNHQLLTAIKNENTINDKTTETVIFQGMKSQKAKDFVQFARVNTVITDVESVIKILTKGHNFQFIDQPQKNTNENNSDLEDIDIDCKTNDNSLEFWMDDHIPNLMAFSNKCKIAPLPICINQHLIIQNKSSCMPAFIIGLIIKEYFSNERRINILDACAGPGNKTSHLVCVCNSFVQQKQSFTITAMDYDSKRLNILRKRMKRMKISQFVNSFVGDFLQFSSANEMDIVLVDPTCSGSGLKYHRISHFDEQKLKSVPNLVANQTALLLHAMTFENVQFIVYSTCSVLEEENESVIERVLEEVGEFEVMRIFPDWKERGLRKYSFGEKCVRCYPEKQGIHGFFVACLRKQSRILERGGKVENFNKKRKITQITNHQGNIPNSQNIRKKRKIWKYHR